MSMSIVTQHPYFMFRQDIGGNLVEYDSTEPKPERSQDLPLLWEANCHTMLSTVGYLLEERRRGGNNVVNFKNFVPYFIQPPSSLDIDEEDDFLLAEFFASIYRNQLP